MSRTKKVLNENDIQRNDSRISFRRTSRPSSPRYISPYGRSDFGDPSDEYLFRPPKRGDYGEVLREMPQGAPCGRRGLADPNSKLRTTSNLLAIISGREQGTVDRVDSAHYDYGVPASPTDANILEVVDGLHQHPYRVDPATVGSYANEVRNQAAARAPQKDDSEGSQQGDAGSGSGSAPASGAE